MKDRFLGGKSATAGNWSNTTGTFSPNTALADHAHTFTGDSHSHNIAHGHADDIATSVNSLSTSDTTHTVTGAVTSATVATLSGYATQDTTSIGSTFAYIISGATYRAHTHTIAHGHADTIAVSEHTSHNHGVTGGVTALGVTNVTETQTGTVSVDDFTVAEATPKATLLNFIIKT
jgi:hypothetical protein